MNEEIDKLAKTNLALQESHKRMALFSDSRNTEIGELKIKIEDYKITEIDLNSKIQTLANVVSMIPHLVRVQGPGPESYQEQRRREGAAARQAAGTTLETIKPEGVDITANSNSQLACSVCFTNRKRIVYGCGHFETCFKCNTKIVEDDSKCPMCRSPILAAIPIHGL